MLRQKGYDLAVKIGKASGIEDAVMHTKCGLGFFMESPQNIFSSALPYYNWWLLFSISEQYVKDESHYPMWNYSDLYHRIGLEQTNQGGSMNELIGSDPSLHHFMFELLHNKELMNDQTFTNVFRLMENCRKIRGTFLENDIWAEQQ